MSLWIISISVAMNSEIKLLTSQNQAFIQSGKQHVLSTSKLLNRNREQTMITPCIASHNRCVAVRARLVRCDDFTLERVFQVYEL